MHQPLGELEQPIDGLLGTFGEPHPHDGHHSVPEFLDGTRDPHEGLKPTLTPSLLPLGAHLGILHRIW
jgi:hypothetical protein